MTLRIAVPLTHLDGGRQDGWAHSGIGSHCGGALDRSEYCAEVLEAYCRRMVCLQRYGACCLSAERRGANAQSHDRHGRANGFGLSSETCTECAARSQVTVGLAVAYCGCVVHATRCAQHFISVVRGSLRCSVYNALHSSAHELQVERSFAAVLLHRKRTGMQQDRRHK
jgi:hypothetical protein